MRRPAQSDQRQALLNEKSGLSPGIRRYLNPIWVWLGDAGLKSHGPSSRSDDTEAVHQDPA
uniref:Uncharacterized protein n=1 Tax=Hyaloperonospora arabidopsidis (strain Emoy2) TaxID=559515 RepID=M4BHT1_HYAAE